MSNDNLISKPKKDRRFVAAVRSLMPNAGWDAVKFIWQHRTDWLAYVPVGVATMISVIAAIIQKLRGMPIDWLIIALLGFFSLGSIALGIALGRRKDKTASLSSSNNLLLPSDTGVLTSLEQVNNATEVTSTIEKDEYLNALLSEIVERDEREIHRMVRVFECQIDKDRFDNDIHTVDFTFTVFNGSIYEISISDQIDGHIKFHDEELYQPKKMLDNQAKNLLRGNFGYFIIRQVLSSDDVRFISSKPDNARFLFKDLVVKIVGAGRWHKVYTQPLNLKQVSITKDGRSRL
jgi:hypothetical protein